MTALGFIIRSRETQTGVVGCHICVSVFWFLLFLCLCWLPLTLSVCVVLLPSPCSRVTHKISLYMTNLLCQKQDQSETETWVHFPCVVKYMQVKHLGQGVGIFFFATSRRTNCKHNIDISSFYYKDGIATVMR